MDTQQSSLLFNVFTVYLVPILLGLALAGAAALSTAGALWWHEKKKQSKLWGLLELVKSYAFDALLYSGAEFRREYERLVADGNLSAADRSALRKRGVELIKEWLGVKTLGSIQKMQGWTAPVLDTYLNAQVDQAVAKVSKVPVSLPAGVAAAASAIAALTDSTPTPAHGTALSLKGPNPF